MNADERGGSLKLQARKQVFGVAAINEVLAGVGVVQGLPGSLVGNPADLGMLNLRN
jgi:hypothetical protein